MTVIHAFRRTKPHTVELDGVLHKFTANAEGQHVCDVPGGPAVKRLLEISDAYRLHAAPAADDSDPEDDPSPYILTAGDETVDLRTMDQAALQDFCKQNEISYHPSAKAETLRDKIVNFFRVE
jgi:hypothetical protein